MKPARYSCIPCTVRTPICTSIPHRKYSTVPNATGFDRSNPHLLSVAPMMEYTNKHFRFFMRQITKRTFLYSEMVATQALFHNTTNKEKLDTFLAYNDIEHPIALQVGGSELESLLIAVKMANDYAYDELNLNCGCPSDSVQAGCFGAVLMKDPKRVADLTHRMIESSKIPISVKCRIGVDNEDSYHHLHNFISTVSASGVEHFIIHARKAYLKGLSPKQNRSVPELNYNFPHQLITDFPHIKFSINGGINSLTQAKQHLQKGAYGVMIGRQSFKNPLVYFHADSDIYGETEPQSFLDQQYQLYQNDEERKEGVPVRAIKELLRHYRDYAHEEQQKTNSAVAPLYKAIEYFVPKSVRQRLFTYKSIKILLDDTIKEMKGY